ncbi:MAG: hypothetical protein SGPRY_003918, partial [Prymnesium sp.]
MCANVADPPNKHTFTSYAACSSACAASGGCTGFSFRPVEVVGHVVHWSGQRLIVGDGAEGECEMVGALETRAVSACERTDAQHSSLSLKRSR